ncbi:hypothetical protein HanIR_Chr10g0482281 [Helianthus annuus]|nr:hypothetical protein HanIR_Chr10g0482281 [Helianthus annuus]
MSCQRCELFANVGRSSLRCLNRVRAREPPRTIDPPFKPLNEKPLSPRLELETLRGKLTRTHHKWNLNTRGHH